MHQISEKTDIVGNERMPVKHVLKLICVALCLTASACTSVSEKKDKIVARVGDKVLYFSDMIDIFPKESTKEDSLSLARLFINNWIETQLMLRKAELNLSDDQANISKEIETYRTSLLIYKYEEQLLREKLDTVVNANEIQSYYEANTANFSLDDYVVKALFLKIAKDAPNINDVKYRYMSDREKDVEWLTHYCYNYADKYDFFGDDWVLWSKIEAELPQKEIAAKQIMSQYGRIEQEDDKYVYLVRIKERRTPGETAPLVIVKEKVKNIIINKLKLKFISELEQNIYNDALRKKQFEIYDLH